MIVPLRLWLPDEWTPYSADVAGRLLSERLDAFSASYPDLYVEITVKPAHGRGGLLDFLRTAQAAAPSVMPDLIVLDVAELETAARLGLIQPLDALLSPADVSDRFPFAAEMATVDGQTFGVVFAADMEHLAYRTDVLPSPPVSWTQVLSPPVSFIFPAAGQEYQINDATLIQYLAAGGKPAAVLDKEALISTLNFYSDCVRAALSPLTLTQIISLPVASPPISPSHENVGEVISPTQWVTSTVTVTIPHRVSIVISPTIVLSLSSTDQAWEWFLVGEGDMTVVRAGRYWREADSSIAAAPIPTRDGQPLTIARRGWAIALVAQDPTRQALALYLFDWLTAPDYVGEWTQAAGYLPAMRSALRAWRISNAERAVLWTIMDSAVPPPRPEVMSIIGPPLQEALQDVLRGESTPQEAADAAAQMINR